MATHELPLSYVPDNSGGVFDAPAENAMTLGTAVLGTLPVTTILAPTGADIGVYGSFVVPQNYVGTPVLVLRGAIAEAANVLGFGCQQLGVDDSETIDAALEAEDTASVSTWTGYAAEDLIEVTITLTPAAAYQAGDVVLYFVYRDDSVDTQTGEFHLLDLSFRYADA